MDFDQIRHMSRRIRNRRIFRYRYRKRVALARTNATEDRPMKNLKPTALTALSGGWIGERKDRNESRQALVLFLRTYRKTGDAEDPETYLAALLYALDAYPIETVRRVLDPRGSFRMRNRYVPDPSELGAALAEEQR